MELYPALQKTTQLPETGQLTLAGLSTAAVQYVLLTLLRQERTRCTVLVAGGKQDYLALGNFLRINAIAYYPLPFISPWGRGHFTSQTFASQQRITALATLSDVSPPLYVTTLPALCQYTLAPDTLATSTVHLKKGDCTDFEQLCAQFVRLGYLQAERAWQAGEFAVRGGIIDLFTVGSQHPHRLEFFGDEIASLRTFDAESMRSRQQVEELRVLPVCEAVLQEGDEGHNVQLLFDSLVAQNLPTATIHRETEDFRSNYNLTDLTMYLPLFREKKITSAACLPSDSIFIFPQSQAAAENFGHETRAALQARYEEDRATQRSALPLDAHFAADFILPAQAQVLSCDAPQRSKLSFYRTTAGELRTLEETLSAQLQVIRELLEEGMRVVLLASFKSGLTRIANILMQEEIPFRQETSFAADVLAAAQGGEVLLANGTLDSTLFSEELRLFVIPDHVLLQTEKARARDAVKAAAEIMTSFDDLEKNDLVVHNSHGIGRYTDIVTLDIDDSMAEYMVINYAHNDKVYLPVDKFNTLQKYISGREESFAPTLDSLRQKNFQLRKRKVEEKAREMAEKLLRNHARRKMLKAQALSAPSEAYFKFEAGFPYAETDAQLRAIDDVNADLSTAVPMDRLICGDVGFGKTEVALRATMRAVSGGTQVLLLAPTTILTLQHFHTFSKRFAPSNISVGLVNRLVSKGDVDDTVKKFNRGKLEIIIGTHRILGLQLRAQNIALVIIDEEQKFGVGHKESLKSLKPEAHILTLSATPIPRTLHMSLMGLKDISMIAEPPQDRMAVKTYVIDYNEQVLQTALNYEIARHGQIYFVHNRIHDIYQMQQSLQKLIPQARIVVAHGKLPKTELEQAIVDFIRQKFNILLCTTIIESGIDMPNVNTLVVNRADCFGLAQLYQLRGRVGRSDRQAHAYFLMEKDGGITEEAQKRLQVLATHYELGSGFKVAHKDLEIRGAGNLMGSEQSGSVAAVGLDMFTSLVDREIKRLRGQDGQDDDDDIDPEIKIPVSAVIPKSYIDSENQRLKLYKKIFSCIDRDELTDTVVETEDLYGKIPDAVFLLFSIAEIKMHLRTMKAEKMRFYRQGFFQIKLHERSPLKKLTLDTTDFMLQGDNLIVQSAPQLLDTPRHMLDNLNKNLYQLIKKIPAGEQGGVA